jgi:hypothetical protein
MDQILHGILVEVLLYIVVATRLVVGCRPGDTYYRCCFVLTGEMCFAEVAMASAAVAGVLAPRAHVPVDEDVLLHVAVLSEVLFPVRFVAA